MAGLLVYRAVNSWAGPMMEIKRVQREGSKFYKLDQRSTALYNHIQQAAWYIRSRHSHAALKQIGAGEKLDPANPVFDYLRAQTAAEQGDMPTALARIRRGNAKGVMRTYGSRNVPPGWWRSGEIDIAARLAKHIAEDQSAAAPDIEAALAMTEKLTWCEPTDLDKLLTAVLTRHAVAKRLHSVAKKKGDRQLADLCQALMTESRLASFAVRRRLALIGNDSTTRATVIGRTLRGSDQEFRNATMLYVRDRQAALADECRRELLKTKVPGEMGR